ncbi:hypothetical protein IGI04_041557 [Brassica rapa subsp. trilocularis]|uniref:Uncharacterized protein n=1 Tax=Brassica rapa subsp. trilocularis TaxID=1813537 RepID=A0ABQ7KTZ3_BRACM|nr:hypothetical protein IGI04_041557 [Brassica rapa subsp. trilocularis]
MDEQEFRSILQLFPVVRSRDHRVSVGEPIDLKDCRIDQDTFTFWDKLRAAAAKKVGEVEAERFCKAFEKLHKKLVYEELDPVTAKRYLLNS